MFIEDHQCLSCVVEQVKVFVKDHQCLSCVVG